LGQGAIGFCGLNKERLNLSVSLLQDGRMVDDMGLMDVSVDIPTGLEKLKAVLCVPVLHKDGHCIGVLEMVNKRTARPGKYTVFTEDDAQDMIAIANAVATALARLA